MRNLSLVLRSALLLILFVGCGQGVQGYLSSVNPELQKLEALSTKMGGGVGETLRKLPVGDKPTDDLVARAEALEKASQEYVEFAEQLSKSREKLESLKVPPKAQGAHSVIVESFKQWITLAENLRGLCSDGAKWCRDIDQATGEKKKELEIAANEELAVKLDAFTKQAKEASDISKLAGQELAKL